ncbi:MAG TPA: peptide ABC transporter substrate-binding protein [Methylocella sp.]|nr:peptide ABC transporter substrate-binding protein [Methylocella sp.]
MSARHGKLKGALRRLSRAAGLLPIVLALEPTAIAGLADDAKPKMVWHRGELGDPGSLDPHKATTLVESNILDELFEGLIALDARGEIIPGVAESWKVDGGGTVYVFKLRPDAKWSNGDFVVAEDFVYALRRLTAPSTGAPYASILYTLKNAEKINKGELPIEALGARALDDRSLEVTLEQPTPYFIAQLAHMSAKPLHQKSIEAFGSDFVHPAHMVTNGPFMLQEFTPNEKIVLVKSPNYYDAAQVRLDTEIFYSLEDRAAGLRRFMAGEIQSYDDVPVEQIGFVRAHLADSFKVSPSLASYFYAFDTRHKPFDDKRVRQALAMVIDREYLAERIWGGTMEASYSFVPPGIESYGAPETVIWKDMDPFAREDQARRLLTEAGFGEGSQKLKVEIRYNNSENHRATAVAIADMWKALGVEARLFAVDAVTHYAFLHEKPPFDVARSGWFADFPDAQNFLFLAQGDNQALNVASFKNDSYDGLLREARGEASPERRRALLHKAEALLLDEQPNLVLLTYESRNLVSPKLKGWEPNVRDQHSGLFRSCLKVNGFHTHPQAA